ncbi:hypothetical protein [Nesterenkonia sp. HG001]|nr:hypothetical protein [Nesterenkonia sp. HG001]MDZ5076783.1 hypothetical protein [Nesterenkonia sp. HG001]
MPRDTTLNEELTYHYALDLLRSRRVSVPGIVIYLVAMLDPTEEVTA